MGELPATFVPGFHDENEVRKMKYREFGNTGLKVSELSFGTATFCYLYGEYTIDECRATLVEALKKGINYIDTAPYYGHGVSEEVLGKCLEGIPRQAYYIATKVGRYEKDPKLMFDFSAKKTKESLQKSLERLHLDYVDILQVHDIEFAPSLEVVLNGAIPAVKEAKDQGKTRFIGVTGYVPSILRECIERSTVAFDTILCYSRLCMLDQGFKDQLPFVKSKKLAFINAAPHCQGLLTNRGPQEWQSASKEIKDACREAAAYCEKNNVELGKLTLYDAIHQEGPSTNLVGINCREVLRSNLDPCFNGLTEKETEIYNYLLTNIFSKLKKTDWEQVEVDAYYKALNEQK